MLVLADSSPDLANSTIDFMTVGRLPVSNMFDIPTPIDSCQLTALLLATGMNSRWQSGQHRVYMYSKGRTLNMYPQLCSLLFLDFWLFFLYYDGMKSVIHT